MTALFGLVLASMAVTLLIVWMVAASWGWQVNRDMSRSATFWSAYSSMRAWGVAAPVAAALAARRATGRRVVTSAYAGEDDVLTSVQVEV